MNRLPTASSPSERASVAVRRRNDLRAVETRHQNESAIVVKDPIALQYHRLRPDEYFVLQCLDGTNSLEQIRDAYESEYAPQKVTPAALNQLILRFHQSGLTLSDSPLQGDRLADRRRDERRRKWTQQISGVLFIRFPGVDPEPLLKRLYPVVAPVFRPTSLFVAASFCVIALVCFLTQWDRFVAEFPRMSAWVRADSILILASVIGVTKVMHELGHAVVCKHFGGECHQIGPMLLVFTPALYCDTSDSWMLPNRFQRAAVGLAGIATEVILAAIATMIWINTGPGLVHYLAMNVMLVCSVSTLLFNANPLLRYDGYYVLSDLCDVPNLGERSRSLLSSDVNRWLFGVDETTGESYSSSSRFWITIYGICSAVYRWGLTLLILWFVSQMLRPYRLESVGRVLCLFAACGLGYTLMRGPVRFLGNPARRRKMKAKRIAITTVIAGTLVAITLIPIPSGISVNARLLPRQEHPIYISTPGLLESISAKPGETVIKGDPIATLVNHDVEFAVAAAKKKYESQKSVVESLRRIRFETPEASDELPSAESLLESLKEQWETKRRQRDGLTIRAPASGRLIAGPARDAVPNDELTLVKWTGLPIDRENKNCFVETGQELMSVIADDRWDAEMVLSQSQVQRFKTGARVKLAPVSAPSTIMWATVTDISRAKWTDQDRARRDAPTAQRENRPAETSYLIRAHLEEPEQGGWIAGSSAKARIEATPISLLGRVTRLLNGLLRFR